MTKPAQAPEQRGEWEFTWWPVPVVINARAYFVVVLGIMCATLTAIGLYSLWAVSPLVAVFWLGGAVALGYGAYRLARPVR